jgi:hypothetical protein
MAHSGWHDDWGLTPLTLLVVVASCVAALAALIWFTDLAAVNRWFGDPPSWYWHTRHDIRNAVAPLLYLPQVFATIGVAFVLLGMWAYSHPSSYGNTRREVYWYPNSETWEAKVTREDWHVRASHSGARELRYLTESEVPDEDGGPDYIRSEGVSITVRPYWAMHIIPRFFYRLEVKFPYSKPTWLIMDANGKRDPRRNMAHTMTAAVTFTCGDKTSEPIYAEQLIDPNYVVSYDRNRIKKLLRMLEACSGAAKVRVLIKEADKVVDDITINTPATFQPTAVKALLRKVQTTTTVFVGNREHDA